MEIRGGYGRRLGGLEAQGNSSRRVRLTHLQVWE